MDQLYQRTLESVTRVRRSVADVATSRKRVELQIEQLEHRLDALEDERGVPDDRDRHALVTGQLAGQREEYDRLRGEEKRVTVASMRLQAKVDAFRTRKEATKASWTAAEGAARADQAIERAEAELDEAIAAADGTRLASGRQAADPGRSRSRGRWSCTNCGRVLLARFARESCSPSMIARRTGRSSRTGPRCCWRRGPSKTGCARGTRTRSCSAGPGTGGPGFLRRSRRGSGLRGHSLRGHSLRGHCRRPTKTPDNVIAWICG